MDEREWLRARDPEAMLAAVRERMTERKWVLLNCAVARRMADEWPGAFTAGFIDEYELEPTAVPRNVFEVNFDGHPRAEWEPPEPPLPAKQRDHPAYYYEQQARRFELRSGESWEASHAARLEFLSHFPMFTNASETWPHCRAILSTALHMAVRGGLYAAAERRVRGFVRKKSKDRLAQANTEKAEQQVREVRKQLTEDMNAAMRNYAKPARELLAHFLHEQLGNPYQPYSFDPSWRTANVAGLARGIEADRGFDRMNILADALMEAGCEDEPVLRHLQEEREHQRGCWVLDLILGHDAELFAMEPLLGTTGTEGRYEPLGLAEPRNWDV